MPVAADCICVMAWSEVSSQLGATDWRVFRMVMEEIEEMTHDAPGLCLQKMALYVDDNGQVSKALDISNRHLESLDASELLSFEFDEDGKDSEDVDPDLVLPSSYETTKLSNPHQPLQQAAVPEGTRHCVDAFFAKKVDDQGIDVHAEGQLMMREILDPVNAGSRWDCNVNPQPTLHDLRRSIASCSQRNVRVLHLAGHGREECGFIWNAHDDAKDSKEFDVDAISLAIGMAAGDNGPLECAVLNACSTERMGRLLRTHNVPCVICWKTSVHDETAKKFCKLFYRSLSNDSSGKRDYRVAFLAATNDLRLSAHTGGTRTKSRGDAFDEDVVASTSPLHCGNTRSLGLVEAGGSSRRGPVRTWHVEDVVLFLSNDGDSDPIYLWRERLAASSPSTLAPAGAIVLKVLDAAEELIDAGLQALFEQRGLGDLCYDVCKFLGVVCVDDLSLVKSEELGDLPKYLTEKHQIRSVKQAKLENLVQDVQSRKSPVHAATLASGAQTSAVDTLVATTHVAALEASGSRGTRRIYAFYAKHAEDRIDVHREAQNVMQNLQGQAQWQNFELNCFPMPTFDSFKHLIRACAAKNVVLTYFAGHSGEGGGLCFNTTGIKGEMEMLGPDQVAPVIARASNCVPARAGGGTIECVVLNACYTRPLGVALRGHGVPNVVCWHGAVKDSHAIKFAEEFFLVLVTSPTEYTAAFDAGKLAVMRHDPVAVRRLFFLSTNREEEAREDEALDSAHGLGNQAVTLQHAAGQSGGEGVVGASGGHDNADIARMANNVKGRAELKGFLSLGVVLKFHGNDIEEGIRKYEASQIDGRHVREYGLDESPYDLWIDSNKVAGKKLLMIRTEALQHIFGDVSISDYASLWKVGGAVDKKAQQTDSIARKTAVAFFRVSLNARQQLGGGDTRHQHMLDEMRHCIKRMQCLVRDDRRKEDTVCVLFFCVLFSLVLLVHKFFRMCVGFARMHVCMYACRIYVCIYVGA